MQAFTNRLVFVMRLPESRDDCSARFVQEVFKLFTNRPALLRLSESLAKIFGKQSLVSAVNTTFDVSKRYITFAY
jgi:hypothetical protein